MSKLPMMPLWVPDIIADTQELDGREFGAYMLILMSLWQRGGKLPSDPQKLKRVARVSRGWDAVWDGISHYFDDDGQHISNARLTEELTIARAKSTANAKNGARGGRAKALKDKQLELANAKKSPQHPEPESEDKKEEAKASPQKNRGTRLSKDWVLPDAWGQWALSKQYPEQAIRTEAEKFRDYWVSVPGQKGVKLDWLATWRNWMRNSNTPKLKAIQGGQHGTTSNNPDRLQRVITAAAEGTSGQDWG